MADEVYMDVPLVEAFVRQLENALNVARTVDRLLEQLGHTLKATAFVTLGGTKAVEVLVSRVRIGLREFMRLLEEEGIPGLNGAILAYRDGDYSGSQRFV